MQPVALAVCVGQYEDTGADIVVDGTFSSKWAMIRSMLRPGFVVSESCLSRASFRFKLISAPAHKEITYPTAIK
jgi:hypothetical protein